MECHWVCQLLSNSLFIAAFWPAFKIQMLTDVFKCFPNSVMMSPGWIFGINRSFMNTTELFGPYTTSPMKLLLSCNILNIHWLFSGNARLCHVYYTHIHQLIHLICRIIVPIE